MTDTISIIAIVSAVSALLLGGLKIVKSSKCCNCMEIITRSVPPTPNARVSQPTFDLQPVKRERTLSDPIKPRPSLIPVPIECKV
jgi:hypothetical protein